MNSTFSIYRSEKFCLFYIVAIGLLTRLGTIAGYPHLPESDEVAYLSMALNLVNGKGIIDSAGNFAMYNVGYPLFVLAPVFYVFGENLFAARIVNVCMGGLAI